MKAILRRKIVSYGRGRFLHIFTIWGALGVVIALLRWKLPESRIVVGSANLMDAELIKDLADYRLIIALVLGVIFVVGLYHVLRSNTYSSEGDPRGLVFTSRVMDELSSALTHFAWLTVLYFLLKEDFSLPAWLHLLSIVIYFGLALLTYAIEPLDATVKGISHTLAPSEAGALKPGVQGPTEPIQTLGSSRLDAGDYDVRIVSPKNHAEVGETCHVSGTIAKELPSGYKIWVVRRWSSEPAKYYPAGEAVIQPTQDGKSFEWHAEKCYIGGREGFRDGRVLEAYIVGLDGLRFIEAWREFDKRFWDVQRKAPNVEVLSPALHEVTSDMEKCNTRRDVVRV